MSVQPARNYDLSAAIAEVEQRFTASNPKSKSNYDTVCGFLPGGNSRTVLFYSPFPLTLSKGEGCHVFDLDGHKYTDFVGEYTAGLYGHSNPTIVAAIKDALDKGIVLGGHNEYEGKLAAAMCARWPSVQRVRFTNSGTEANLMAVSTARAVTKRSKILVFEGGYHGAVFYYSAGSQVMNAPFPTVIAPFNDTDATVALIRKHADDLACVVVEPMQAGGGSIPGKPEFLKALREETQKCGALLIFDEVVTSRLSPGGAQAIYKIMPDLTSFGKYIGGGLTFGAFGGRADIMDRFDPRRPDALPHAGTFNQNVLTMAAGVTGLTKIYTPEVAVQFNARGDKLRERLNAVCKKRGLPVQWVGMGSTMTVHFTDRKIESVADSQKGNQLARALLHHDMLTRAHYPTRRGMYNLSLPMGEKEFDGLVSAFDEFLAERGALLA